MGRSRSGRAGRFSIGLAAALTLGCAQQGTPTADADVAAEAQRAPAERGDAATPPDLALEQAAEAPPVDAVRWEYPPDRFPDGLACHLVCPSVCVCKADEAWCTANRYGCLPECVACGICC